MVMSISVRFAAPILLVDLGATPLHRTKKVLKDPVVDILPATDDNVKKLCNIFILSSISTNTPRKDQPQIFYRVYVR